MDRQMVVNLIRNQVVESPKGKSRLWVVRYFEINVRPDRVVEVDEYEAYEVCEGDGTGTPGGDGASAVLRSPSRMYHVGRSVIYLEEQRVVEEPIGKGRLEVGAAPAGR